MCRGGVKKTDLSVPYTYLITIFTISLVWRFSFRDDSAEVTVQLVSKSCISLIIIDKNNPNINFNES